MYAQRACSQQETAHQLIKPRSPVLPCVWPHLQVKNKMSKADFLRNNRGINDGGDLPQVRCAGSVGASSPMPHLQTSKQHSYQCNPAGLLLPAGVHGGAV